MTHRPAFVEHQSLAYLLPHLQSYAWKALQETKLNGGKFRATAKELFAANVFERVGELDNSVKSLRLAMDYVLNLDSTHEDAPDVYRYHYENFLLRLTGIVDRAHLLVGTSLQLSPSKLKKIGANSFVAKHVTSNYPELDECLRGLSNVASKYKTPRNEIAHTNAFSSRELGLFSAIVFFRLEVGDWARINNLMNSFFSESGAKLAALVAEMVSGVEALLDALAPIHECLATEIPN